MGLAVEIADDCTIDHQVQQGHHQRRVIEIIGPVLEVDIPLKGTTLKLVLDKRHSRALNQTSMDGPKNWHSPVLAMPGAGNCLLAYLAKNDLTKCVDGNGSNGLNKSSLHRVFERMLLMP